MLVLAAAPLSWCDASVVCMSVKGKKKKKKKRDFRLAIFGTMAGSWSGR